MTRHPVHPPGFYDPRTPLGTCVYCRRAIEPVLKKDGTPRKVQPNWHAKCVHVYRIAAWPRYAREVVWERDHGVCAACGQQNENYWGWDVDHKVPLWSVDRRAPDAHRYWMLGNLQTLCASCHKEKTALEAAERAKGNRIREQQGLLKPKKSKREKIIERFTRKQNDIQRTRRGTAK